ncbi:MAG: hypothetical protein SFW67_33615 [Myxococcaceae bacterium]|nr:hypothetical protein [Myxococcaceae bacterium]
MEPTDLTIEVLKEIRDEGRTTNERINETNKRLDETNERLETGLRELREALSRRIVESEIRTTTALTALSAEVRELTSSLKQTQDLRPRVTQCEQDLAAIKQRLG